ncbi:restriction endonuclease subunit S [Akkermansia muciniphila]|uniref:restriction endonuclease subunit S n=1 Tax=Akkermansia muciniphila TaxID=239935 RepID=UPI000B8EB368|nr:restriction endonuclease subunit S [Akkermansia muciniphila]
MNEKSLVPSIRFTGFTDAWERCKLGDLGKVRSGIGFPDAEQGGTEGLPFFKVSDMNISGNEHEMTKSQNYVSIEQIQRKKWTPILDVPAMFFAKVGAAVLLNRKRLCRTPFLLDNNTMAYSVCGEKWNVDFAKALFDTVNLPSLIQVGALPSYNAGDVESLEITLPNIEEQNQIGHFFRLLDRLITLHQRKYEKLLNIKKSMLDKMFPKNGELFPEVRFAGFTDAWERRKLGEIADKVTEKNSSRIYSETFTNSAENGIISQRDYFDHAVSNSANLDGYYIVSEDDFVYNPRISTTAPVGPINRNRLKSRGVMSPLYTVFRTRDIDALYLEHYFKSHHWHQYMFLNGDSGARSDRFSIKDFVFMEMPIAVPCKVEQMRIGSFLEELDHLITLHQRKLEKLQNIKKACLEKMFV